MKSWRATASISQALLCQNRTVPIRVEPRTFSSEYKPLVRKDIPDLEQRYRAAMAAAEKARAPEEKIARLEEALRLAQTIEWMRNAVPYN